MINRNNKIWTTCGSCAWDIDLWSASCCFCKSRYPLWIWPPFPLPISELYPCVWHFKTKRNVLKLGPVLTQNLNTTKIQSDEERKYLQVLFGSCLDKYVIIVVIIIIIIIIIIISNCIFCAVEILINLCFHNMWKHHVPEGGCWQHGHAVQKLPRLTGKVSLPEGTMLPSSQG